MQVRFLPRAPKWYYCHMNNYQKLWVSLVCIVGIVIIACLMSFGGKKELTQIKDVTVTPVATATSSTISPVKTATSTSVKPVVTTVATSTPVTPSKLKITYPNGGEGLLRGETVNITWNRTSPTPADDITIYLITNLSGCAFAVNQPCLAVIDPEQVITSNAQNTGSFRWTINKPAGTNYYFKICEGAGTSQQSCDISDKTFSIFEITKPPYVLTVTSPNVEETWKLGTSHTMSWELRGEIPAKYQVGLYLENSTGSGSLGVFAASSKTSYTRVVESAFYGDVGKTLAPGKYKVNVMLFDGPINRGNGSPSEKWGKVVAEDSSDFYVNIVE